MRWLLEEPSHLDLCYLQISVKASLGMNKLWAALWVKGPSAICRQCIYTQKELQMGRLFVWCQWSSFLRPGLFNLLALVTPCHRCCLLEWYNPFILSDTLTDTCICKQHRSRCDGFCIYAVCHSGRVFCGTLFFWSMELKAGWVFLWFPGVNGLIEC